MEEYTEQAQLVIDAAQEIKNAIAEHGFGTASIMVILSKLLQMTQVADFFGDLPEDQRDEFFAEIWDAAIGSEPNALVNKVGIFEGETLEQMSDAVKAGFIAYMNREVTTA